VQVLNTAMAGNAAGYLHDQSKYPVPLWLQLPADQMGSLDTALALGVRNAAGQWIARVNWYRWSAVSVIRCCITKMVCRWCM
jgi:hypothetical protein